MLGHLAGIFFSSGVWLFCPNLFKVLSTYSLNDHSSVTCFLFLPTERCPWGHAVTRLTCRGRVDLKRTRRDHQERLKGDSWRVRDYLFDLCSDFFLVFKNCLVSARGKEDNAKIMVRVKGQCTVYMQARKVIKSHPFYLSFKSFNRILLVSRIFLTSFHFPDYLHVLSLYPSAPHNAN